MTFSEALENVKNHVAMCRKGWNGKGMYIQMFYVAGCDPCIAMQTVQGTLQPGWLASQADMLSDDWEVAQ